MPAHKSVTTLSNQCVQRIAEVFIDITKSLSKCSANKKKESLASQKTEERDTEQNSEESNKENADSNTENQNISDPPPELLGKNGYTHSTAEHQTEESPASLHEKKDEEKRKKRQRG